MIKKYKYFEPVELEDHYYFAEEILEIFSTILDASVKAKDIHYIIKNYIKDSGNTIRVLYYQTSKGLKRVYPVDVAMDAIAYSISNANKKSKEAKLNGRL